MLVMVGFGYYLDVLVGTVLALVQKLHVQIYFRLCWPSIYVSIFEFDLNDFLVF